METEIRFYYPKTSEANIIKHLRQFPELKEEGTFHETTEQYNHPMPEYDFYSKAIDGRFRIRKSESETSQKCLLTWKRRLQAGELVHSEEEIELTIDPSEYQNLIFILTKVLHLTRIESYERYRTVFTGKNIEIVVDRYPFGVALEIESKGTVKNAPANVKKWTSKIGLNSEEAYPYSWDDKYRELCQSQGIKPTKIVTFAKTMPQVQSPKFNPRSND